ncbi:MAG: hypothetical protein K8H88_02510 [Sandaracinaceae bacterium]|nr:hypothetical protein [Sandaracinaceae bacterium]
MTRLLASGLLVGALSGCTTGQAGLSDDDSDGDTISDLDEGFSRQRDTDGDATPDYLDTDSDGDTLADSLEAGDRILSTVPSDSDADTVADYLDLDSDDNGLLDRQEGTEDSDLDGQPDFADDDDDDDLVDDRAELAGVLGPFLDSDFDMRPNFRDPDSDDDLILDGHEFGVDTDRDGRLDHEDLDSDGDGLSDLEEAGDEDLLSQPISSDDDAVPDFRDTDSDNDGMSDRIELRTHTDPRRADSDADGVNDLIEAAAGTDPLDSAESPLTRGDFVFVVPHMEPPTPERDILAFRTSIQLADTYFLFDRSESMIEEIATLATSVTTVLSSLTCHDYGVSCRSHGDCGAGQTCSIGGSCVEDPATSSCLTSPWSGVGYYEMDVVNQLPLQSAPLETSSALRSIPLSGGLEDLYGSVWSLLDPAGSPDRETGCISPTASRIGCAGFRDDAVRILVAFTDERGDNTATVEQAAAALVAADTTFIGVSSGAADAHAMLEALAIRSGSLDGTGAPLVFDASATGAGIDTVVASAIREIVESVPLHVTIEATDEPGDAGDALQFLDRLEVEVGGGRCSAGHATEDTDADGHDDAFASLPPGAPVCWSVVARRNETIRGIVDVPQVFEARLTVYGDGSPLDSRVIYFLVPPCVELPGGEFGTDDCIPTPR